MHLQPDFEYIVNSSISSYLQLSNVSFRFRLRRQSIISNANTAATSNCFATSNLLPKVLSWKQCMCVAVRVCIHVFTCWKLSVFCAHWRSYERIAYLCFIYKHAGLFGFWFLHWADNCVLCVFVEGKRLLTWYQSKNRHTNVIHPKQVSVSFVYRIIAYVVRSVNIYVE